MPSCCWDRQLKEGRCIAQLAQAQHLTSASLLCRSREAGKVIANTQCKDGMRRIGDAIVGKLHAILTTDDPNAYVADI